MKKLIIAALAIAAATTMYAQGTINMATANPVTYGTSCGDLAGNRIGNDFVGSLLYEGQVVASENFAMSAKGKPTGKLVGDVASSTLVPAGAEVTFTLHAQDVTNLYKGDSAPFTYTTGDAADPTKLPDTQLVFDSFTVEYVPEPTTIALGILGLSSLFVLRRRD